MCLCVCDSSQIILHSNTPLLCKWWIVWGFRLSSDEHPNDELSGACVVNSPRVSVCPVVNCPMVNCLGFLSVQWWTAQRWIVWCFCWPVVNCLAVKCPTPICSWDCQCHSCMGLFSQCCNTTWIAQSTNEFQSSDARRLYYLLLAVEGTTGLAYRCRMTAVLNRLRTNWKVNSFVARTFPACFSPDEDIKKCFYFFLFFLAEGRSEGTILRSPAWLVFEVADFRDSTSKFMLAEVHIDFIEKFYCHGLHLLAGCHIQL